MHTCPQCGGRITSTRNERSHRVAGVHFVVRTSAFACRKCRETFVAGETLERADTEIACLLAHKGAPSGAGLRYMRHVLGLRATALATLLTVTPETVSRWENEQRAVDPIAWVAVGSLVLERAGRTPHTMQRFEALQSPRRPAESVLVDLTRRPRRAPRARAPISTRRVLVRLSG